MSVQIYSVIYLNRIILWPALVDYSSSGSITPSKSYLWCPWSPATKESQGWPWLSLDQGLPWPALAVLGRRRPKPPKIGFGGGDRSRATLVNQCWPKYSPVQIYHRVYLYSHLCTVCSQYTCTVSCVQFVYSTIVQSTTGWP